MTLAARRRLLGSILALTLGAVGLSYVGAPRADAATPALTVAVDCFSSRERTMIRNDVVSVGVRVTSSVGTFTKRC